MNQRGFPPLSTLRTPLTFLVPMTTSWATFHEREQHSALVMRRELGRIDAQAPGGAELERHDAPAQARNDGHSPARC